MRKPSILGRGYWRLLKGLYGLKQAGRQWYKKFIEEFAKIGFRQIESDWSVHTCETELGRSMTATSVDDILVASTTKAESDQVAKDLGSLFEITDSEQVESLLGCRITRNRARRSIKIDQEIYITSILRQFGMEHCNSATTPLPPKLYLTKHMCPTTQKEREEVSHHPYREVVGKCMYLSTCTRPDISYAVRELARFMSNFGTPHWNAARHLLRYLQGTRSHGLTLGNVDDAYPIFKGLCDSDWAMGENRHSVSGYLILLGTSPIAWSSKQQAVVALSSCEAEYLSCSHCARQILWLRNLFNELGYPQNDPTILLCDNSGTILASRDPQSHSRMKHIDIRHHFIRHCVNNNLIDLRHVPGTQNISDLLTKPLHRLTQAKWVSMLQLDSDQGGVLTSGDPASSVAIVPD